MNTLIQFINPGSIQINVLDKPDRKSVKVLHDFEEYVSPIFYKGDSVKGNVKICVPLHQKPIKFKRLKISLIGTITDNKYFVKRTFSYETIEIIRAGSVAISTWFDFEFERPKLPYESFGGKLFEIEYILVATVVRSITNIECKHPIFVQVCGIPTPSVSKYNMCIGYTGSLHIEFQMEKTIFEINETFIANLKLQCVETKLKHADISLVRTEMMTTEALDEIKNVLFEWEIFNGATVRGQTIPVRFFLDRLSLGPTLENMEDEYSVLYNLNLTVSDENDRSFFQLIPIKLFRRKPEHTTIN